MRFPPPPFVGPAAPPARSQRIVVRVFTAVAAALLVATSSTALAETLHVAVTGDDSAPGTESQPLRTIQRAADRAVAGDTVLVHPGRYHEHVATRTHGNATARITFRAAPVSEGMTPASVRGFRIDHRYVTVQGFDVTHGLATEHGNFSVYINAARDRDGSHCEILDNDVHDGVYLIVDDLHIDAASQTLSTPTGDFRARGFEPGDAIYLGADSRDPYENHDVRKTIRDISPDGHSVTLVESLLPETRDRTYAVLYVNDRSGYPGVRIELGSDTAPTDCVVRGNHFRNLFGGAIHAFGERHLVEENVIEDGHGWDAVRFFGSGHVFRRNVIRNSPHFIYFTQEELAAIAHETGRFYDFQISLLYSYGEHDHDILFENNYVENCYNQLGFFEGAGDSRGLTFRGNVFIGVPAHLSLSRPDTRFENNTFFRAAYEASVAIAAGPRGSATLPGIALARNAFVDVGARRNIDTEGWIGATATTTVDADGDFIAGPVSLGYPVRGVAGATAPNAIRGGDPLFVDQEDPDGPDDVPLTDDDGLRPLPTSPLCASSATGNVLRGAYACLSCDAGEPFAHFGVAEPRDLLGIPEQGNYRLPEVLGHAPVTASFDPASSVSCAAGTVAASSELSTFRWSFGDCTPDVQTSSAAAVQHFFPVAGDYTVMLTVTDRDGRTDTYRRTFRVLPSQPHEVLRLHLDGDLGDASGRPHRVRWEGSASYETGRRAMAATLAGSAVVVAARDDLDGARTLSFGAWVRRQSATSFGVVLQKHRSYTLRFSTDGRVGATVALEGAASDLSAATTLPADLAWHHYAATFDGATLRLFVDGVESAQATAATPGTIQRHREFELVVGRGPVGDALAAAVDDVFVDDRPLSGAQLAAIAAGDPVPECETAAECVAGNPGYGGPASRVACNGGRCTFTAVSAGEACVDDAPVCGQPVCVAGRCEARSDEPGCADVDAGAPIVPPEPTRASGGCSCGVPRSSGGHVGIGAFVAMLLVTLRLRYRARPRRPSAPSRAGRIR